MDILKEIMELSEINHKKDLVRGLKEHLEVEYLFKAIEGEIDEAREEVKLNNIPYLEDELSDIIWGWFMLTKRLEKLGYVTSQDKILKRALKKFQERVLPMNSNLEHDIKVWKEVKSKAKRETCIRAI